MYFDNEAITESVRLAIVIIIIVRVDENVASFLIVDKLSGTK